MLFLTFSRVDIQFAEGELTWRFYTIKKALLATSRVKLINKKEFAKIALDDNIKVFVVQFSFLSLKSIYLDGAAQIVSLVTEKVIILNNYSDFANVSWEKQALVLSEQTKFNQHGIKLQDDKQPLYRPIYSLGLAELETLKTYIKTNLANCFIQFSSQPLVPSFFLYKNQMVVFIYALIIKASTISRSKIDTLHPWLESHSNG